MSNYISYPATGGGGGGGGITSINGDTTPAQTIAAGTGISVSTAGGTTTITNTETPGTGTVTSVSVVPANGLSGTVATATTTPAITLSTTVTGILQGNGTAISAATTGNLTDVGTDGITVTGGTGAVLGSGTSLSQHVADTTHNGYLSSTDWNTFNNKQPTITTGNLTDAGTDGITVTGGTGAVVGSGTSIAQQAADATHNGYLKSTDWSTFNGKGSGTVTSVAFAGDGTVLSSTPSSAVTTSGNVTASLANAGGYTFLGNGTASSAAPTYAYGAFGATAVATTSGTIALTVNSPTVQYLNSTLTGNITWTLPQASTCPNKEFVFIRYVGNNSNSSSVSVFSGDTMVSPAPSAISPATTVTTYTFSFGNNKNMQILRIISAGGTQWIVTQLPILPAGSGGTGSDLANALANGSIIYSTSTGTFAGSAGGTSGQILQSAGGGSPTWTSSPGSGTALTGVYTTAVYNSAAQTVVSASTSGSVTYSQPQRGSSYKKIVAYCSAALGTASYIFPTAFVNTPQIMTTNGPAASIVTTLSTTTMTITGATTTGFVLLEGY